MSGEPDSSIVCVDILPAVPIVNNKGDDDSISNKIVGVSAVKCVRIAAKTAPDGGYGWVIVVASFLMHFMLVGFARSIGMLYTEWLDRFQGSHSQTVWVAALFNTCRSLTAPVCSVLCDAYGCRLITLIGGVLLCTGFFASAFATRLWQLYFTFGILAGLGGAMVFVPAYIMVGQYFNKNKGKAMGISTIGSGLGNICFSFIVYSLLTYMSYYGTMIIVAGLQLHHLISGCLYRPILVRKRQKELTLTNPELKQQDQTLSQELKIKGDPLLKSQSPVWYIVVHTALVSRVSLFANITYVLYGCIIIGMQFCIMIFLIFLPNYVTENGYGKKEGALVLLIFGICDMCGRFMFGFVFDLKSIRQRRRHLFCVVSFIFGGLVMVLSVVKDIMGICVLTAFIAIFEGATHSQRATILSEVVQPNQMSIALGLLIFFQGVGNLLGLPISGVLRDSFGTSSYSFIFAGLTLCCATCVFVLKFVCHKCISPESKGTLS